MTRKPAVVLIILSIAVLSLAVLPAAGLAAKGGGAGSQGGGGKGGGGGGGGTSTLTLVVLDPDDGGANWGEQVTFELSTTATTQPYVNLNCSQGGTLVYSSSAGFFAGYPWPWAQVFALQSNSWTAGAADCRATLDYWNGRGYRTLASLSFTVLA